MLRRALLNARPEVDSSGFRLRGTEVSRLEGLTDGVFALAMTLLSPSPIESLLTREPVVRHIFHALIAAVSIALALLLPLRLLAFPGLVYTLLAATQA